MRLPWLSSEDTLKQYANGSISEATLPKDQYNTTRVKSVAVDPVDPAIIYVANNRDLWASTNSVVRSVDSGQNWENLTITAPLASSIATSGPREGYWVRVHPQTREAWVATNCFGMWKIPAPSSTGIANGEYTLIARHSGKALDVPGASTTDGVQVTQYQPNGGANQRWIIENVGNGEYTIKAKHSGKALDVFSNSTAEGAAIVQYTPNGGANQRWRIEPTDSASIAWWQFTAARCSMSPEFQPLMEHWLPNMDTVADSTNSGGLIHKFGWLVIILK